MQELIDTVRHGVGILAPYPYVQALVLIVVSLLIAKLADYLVTGLVRRLTALKSSNLDQRVAEILHQPVFVTIFVIGLMLATVRVGLSERLENNTLDILKTVLIWIWLVFALRFSQLAIEAMGRRPRPPSLMLPSTRPLISNAIAILLVLAGAYAILIAWDINVTGLVASAGIVGLALSFAAQDTLSNLFAGLAILMDRPYRIGDFIILDSGERGQVTHIGLRSTRLLTRDDVEVTIPNGVMGAAKIVNEAGGPSERYRLRIPIGVAYGSDIDQVMAVLLEVATAHQKVAKSPEARVRFRQFADSSLNFELLCWISNPVDRGLVTHELNCSIYKAFAAAGVQIPFPQRDIHIRSTP